MPEPDYSFVEYHPEWRTDLRFFVDVENWPRVRPTVESLKARFPGAFNYAPLGHTTESRDGVRFGSTSVEVERAVASTFGLREVLTKPTSQGGAGRPAGSRNLPLPFDKLERVGDHFLVPWGHRHKHVAVAANQAGIRLGRRFKTSSVKDGVLVLLVEGPGLTYNVLET